MITIKCKLPKKYLAVICMAVLLCAIFTPDVLMAYSPPSGIPDPQWPDDLHPIDTPIPSAPTPWEGEIAGYYYIDNTEPGATDSDRTYGYPGAARLTMPTSFSAGSVVFVDGGPYNNTPLVTLQADGTSSDPVWIIGNQDSQAEFQNDWRIRFSSYLIIDNIKWTTINCPIDVRPGTNGENIHHVCFRNCTIIGSGETSGPCSTIALSSYHDTPVSDIVRYNNTIYNCGDWTYEKENNVHALGIGAGIHDIWDLENTVYHMGGDACGNGHQANHTSYNLYIGRNTFYENRENAVDLKEVHNVVVSENHCYSYTPSSSSPGEAIILHYGPTTDQGPYNIWIVNNTIYDAVYGLVTSDVGESIYVIGNVIYDCDVGLNPDRGGGHAYIYHNTIVNCPVGIYCGGTIDALEIHGNLVAHSSTRNMGVDSSAVRAVAGVSHELYYDNSHATIDWGTTYTSVASWIAGTSVGDNSIEQNPVFRNYSENDFRITTRSPAFHAGYDMSTIMSNFYSQWGVPLDKDISGNTRPSGGWDMGAYQAIQTGIAGSMFILLLNNF